MDSPARSRFTGRPDMARLRRKIRKTARHKRARFETNRALSLGSCSEGLLGMVGGLTMYGDVEALHFDFL